MTSRAKAAPEIKIREAADIRIFFIAAIPRLLAKQTSKVSNMFPSARRDG
jgi:hypothetical protein